MKWYIFAGLLTAWVASPAAAQIQEKFAACAGNMGKPYVEARDRFLADPADEAFLKKTLKAASWRERLTARILLGWSQHKDEYVKLLAAPKVTSQSGTSFFAWSNDPEGIQAKHLPLMYEMLMKGTEPEYAMDAARAVLALTQREPTPLDSKLLHQFLQDNESGASESARAAVAWLAGSLSVNYQAQLGEELQKSLKAELARKNRERGITLSLLNGLGVAAKKMSAKEKDALAQVLQNMAGLEDLVGKAPLTYSLGNIGGEKSSEIVVAYLEGSGDKVEKLWALRSLSKSRDSSGTYLPVVAQKALSKYLDQADVALRNEAVAGLGRANYLPDEVAGKLAAIGRDNKAPMLQKRLAVRSLAMIGSTHPGNADLQKQIQSQIQTISDANQNDPQLRKELNDLLKGISP